MRSYGNKKAAVISSAVMGEPTSREKSWGFSTFFLSQAKE